MGKTDVKTKEFWRDNGHFADLFNAIVFHGERILHTEDLTEMDTDASIELKARKKHVDTLTKARDVVRKWAFGTEYVILGIENQSRVDYSEPVRAMSYDSAGYWRECRMISNCREKDFSDKGVFSIGKEDRIHPIVTLVLYYGEEPWDGPRTLHEMFVPTSEEILCLVPDYSINLIEIRNSDHLVFLDPDVEALFSMVRKIYRREIEESDFRNVKNYLAELIGNIVKSDKIVRLARESGKEEVDVCRALEEMMQEREEKGRIEGKFEGKIEAYHDMGFSNREIAEKMRVPLSRIKRILKNAGQEVPGVENT